MESIGFSEWRLPFTVPPMTANEARSGAGHWSKQSDAKKLVAEAVYTIVKASPPIVDGITRCAATLTWYAPDYGRRDCGALSVMMKACLDALAPGRPAYVTTRNGKRKTVPATLGLGIIPDDSANVVVSETLAIVQGSADPRIVLRIDVLPAEGPRRIVPRAPRAARSNVGGALRVADPAANLRRVHRRPARG
jgi:hypothetical protein